jgi:hypothetical protein
MAEPAPLTVAAYADRVRALPLPTAEQYDAFAEHLCTAHSWYKHLPLAHPAEFVVFVTPYAGLRSATPGPGEWDLPRVSAPPPWTEFTEADARMHYAWKTTAEYRERFGFLGYAWRREPSHGWDHDGPDEAGLIPPELRARWSVSLYAYVSPENPEAILGDTHADALALLRAGQPHPAREQVLEWHRLQVAQDDAWQALSREDHDVILELDDEEDGAPPRPDLPAGILEYLALDRALGDVVIALHEQELAKVRDALARLDAWLRSVHGASAPAEGSVNG